MELFLTFTVSEVLSLRYILSIDLLYCLRLFRLPVYHGTFGLQIITFFFRGACLSIISDAALLNSDTRAQLFKANDVVS